MTTTTIISSEFKSIGILLNLEKKVKYIKLVMILLV